MNQIMNQGIFPILILLFAILVLLTSVILTRAAVARRNRLSLRHRLEELVGFSQSREEKLILTRSSPKFTDELSAEHADTNKVALFSRISDFPFFRHLKKICELCELKIKAGEFISLLLLSSLLILCLPFAFELPPLYCAAGALLFLITPYFYLQLKADSLRNKFVLQLPNAIDLMVSILRSGHSIPQSIKSISDECPEPLAAEFNRIFHHMNLGKSLPDALGQTAEKFDSFELDLIRRAATLHKEVGGSLAEVLEKTNDTLRQRIKLKNQINVMTTQGRMSAFICGLLPLVMAIVFNQINPGYLDPLLESGLGRTLLTLAFVLELAGFLIMRKLSSFRI